MSQGEAVLTTMWSGVLSIPQETSGTSLVVIDIINLLHTQTEVRLPMRVPFEGPAIEQMAASLVAQQARGVECVPLASRVVAPVIVLGDRWQPVKWKAESEKASIEYIPLQSCPKLDIFAKSEASVCTDKKSVLKKEMASVLLAERLANMAGVVDILPTHRTGGDGTRAFHADCFATHLVASPVCQVCLRQRALHRIGIFGGSNLQARWHQQQRILAVVGSAGRPRSASNWSRPRHPTKRYTIHWCRLLPPSARAALDRDRSRSPFQVHTVRFRPPSWPKGGDFLQVDPPKAARPHGTSPSHLHDRDQEALRRAAPRAALADSEQSQDNE